MLQIFIVFHKYIFDECYKDISKADLDKYFTFVSVNKKIKKTYSNKYKVIKEWELPHYRPELQEQGYNENSAIYHVYTNKLHIPYKYIGFFQYDMKFNPDTLKQILTKITTNNTMYFHIGLNDYTFCTLTTWKEPMTAEFIIKYYEEYFGKLFSKDALYPLWNSYIIPIELYEKIMPWIIQLFPKLYPWCIQAPNKDHIGHIGGIYERIMAFIIGQEPMDAIKLGIQHDHTLKKKSY